MFRKIVLSVSVCIFLLLSFDDLHGADISITEVKTLDENGNVKSSFDISQDKKIGFSIEVYKETDVGTVQFYYYVNDPDGKQVLYQTGNTIPGKAGSGGSTLKGIAIADFYTKNGVYTFLGVAFVSGASYSKRAYFTITGETTEMPDIDLYLPARGQHVPFESLQFQWGNVGAVKYRITVDDDIGFANPFWQSETYNTSINYPRNPTDPRQKLSAGIQYWWKVDGLNSKGEVVYETKEPFSFYVTEPQGIHDLGIIKIDVKPQKPVRGDRLDIKVEVKNTGSFTEMVNPPQIFIDGVLLRVYYTMQIINLPASQSKVYSYLYKIPENLSESKESINITAVINLKDNNTQNNMRTKTLFLYKPKKKFDLAIKEIKGIPDKVYVGERIPIQVVVMEKEIKELKNIWIELEVDGRIQKEKIKKLLKNKEESVVFNWIPAEAKTYNIKIEAPIRYRNYSDRNPADNFRTILKRVVVKEEISVLPEEKPKKEKEKTEKPVLIPPIKPQMPQPITANSTLNLAYKWLDFEKSYTQYLMSHPDETPYAMWREYVKIAKDIIKNKRNQALEDAIRDLKEIAIKIKGGRVSTEGLNKEELEKLVIQKGKELKRALEKARIANEFSEVEWSRIDVIQKIKDAIISEIMAKTLPTPAAVVLNIQTVIDAGDFLIRMGPPTIKATTANVKMFLVLKDYYKVLAKLSKLVSTEKKKEETIPEKINFITLFGEIFPNILEDIWTDIEKTVKDLSKFELDLGKDKNLYDIIDTLLKGNKDKKGNSLLKTKFEKIYDGRSYLIARNKATNDEVVVKKEGIIEGGERKAFEKAVDYMNITEEVIKNLKRDIRFYKKVMDDYSFGLSVYDIGTNITSGGITALKQIVLNSSGLGTVATADSIVGKIGQIRAVVRYLLINSIRLKIISNLKSAERLLSNIGKNSKYKDIEKSLIASVISVSQAAAFHEIALNYVDKTAIDKIADSLYRGNLNEIKKFYNGLTEKEKRELLMPVVPDSEKYIILSALIVKQITGDIHKDIDNWKSKFLREKHLNQNHRFKNGLKLDLAYNISCNSVGYAKLFGKERVLGVVSDKRPNIPPTITLNYPSNKYTTTGPSVEFKWTGYIGDTLNYTIFIDDDREVFKSPVVKKNLGAQNTFTSKNLKFGKKYYWAVEITDGKDTVRSEVRWFKIKTPELKITYPTKSTKNWGGKIAGTGAIPGYIVKVFIYTNKEHEQGMAKVSKDGSWKLDRAYPTKGTTNKIYAKMFNNKGKLICTSKKVSVKLKKEEKFEITYPKFSTRNWNKKVKGVGAIPGYTVKVYIKTKKEYEQGIANVYSNGTWELNKTWPTKGTTNKIYAKMFNKKGKLVKKSNTVKIKY